MNKPSLPLDLKELPPPLTENNHQDLEILLKPTPIDLLVSFNYELEGAPVNPPRSSGFVTVVEWPLRPGDTRIEAYFIGTDKQRQNWYLWQFTMNDLIPFVPKYIEKKPIAQVPRRRLSKEDAALILIKAVWEHERDEFKTPIFMMVSDNGILDSNFIYSIAEIVWSGFEE